MLPTELEGQLLEVLKSFKGWDYTENEDLHWLREYIGDYPKARIDVAMFKQCRDFHSEKPGDKRSWKNRLRNWINNEKKPAKRPETVAKVSGDPNAGMRED